jgi:hypothetical protein
LKLLCLLRKHKHCLVGKIYQFLTINQPKIQITESFKSLLPQFYGATCQEVSTNAFETSQKCPLYKKLELYYFAAKNEWEGWAYLVLP